MYCNLHAREFTGLRACHLFGFQCPHFFNGVNTYLLQWLWDLKIKVLQNHPASPLACGRYSTCATFLFLNKMSFLFYRSSEELPALQHQHSMTTLPSWFTWIHLIPVHSLSPPPLTLLCTSTHVFPNTTWLHNYSVKAEPFRAGATLEGLGQESPWDASIGPELHCERTRAA